VLQCVAVRHSVLQCVEVRCSRVAGCNTPTLHLGALSSCAPTRCKGTVCCSVLQCVAVCCSALQCVAVCCSALQCVAVC